MTRLEFLRTLAKKWKAVAPGPRLSETDFLKMLAAKAALLPRDGAQADAELDGFRQLIMARPDDLRRKLLGTNALRRRTLSTRQRDLLDALDVEPDLLGPIGELRYEPTHTRLVEYFLRQSRDGLLPGHLLRAFLVLVDAPPELVPDDLTNTTIRRERFSKEGRVDLWLEMPKLVVLVEMKVDAAEGKGQLSGYQKALDAARGTKAGILAYMTLPNAPTADTKVPHVHFTLYDLLRMWIPYADSGRGLPAYLGRYLKSVAQLLRCAGAGRFDYWSVKQQRAALDLVYSAV